MSALTPHRPLSLSESDLLAECEDAIAQGLQTFFDVGNALMSIRENKLYRKTHENFDAYCSEKWGISDSRARQLILAAGTVTNVTDLGLPAPENEAQARALGRVAEEEQAEVWAEVHNRTGGKPTAAAVADVASERAEQAESARPPEPEEPAAASKPFAWPDVDKLRQNPDLDPAAVENYAAATAASSLADWRRDFLRAVYKIRKPIQPYTVAEVAEKADRQSLAELDRLIAEMGEFAGAVQHAINANVVPLRRVK